MRIHLDLRATGVVALLVMGSALMGCSSEGDDAAETPIGQALTEKFLEGGMVISGQEARCVAGGIVDGVGEDRIDELDVTRRRPRVRPASRLTAESGRRLAGSPACKPARANQLADRETARPSRTPLAGGPFSKTSTAITSAYAHV